VSVALAVAAAAGLLAVVELVRRRKLREEFSWLWLLAFAGLLGFAALPRLRASLWSFLVVHPDAASVLALAVLFLLALSIDFSIKVSKLANQQKNLAHEVALLRRRTDEIDPDARGRDDEPA